MKLQDVKVYLFDLDGTIYHDGALIGDVKNTLQTLRENGSKVIYLTNNSSRPQEKYVEKLQKIGIWTEGDRVYSSLDCAVDFFARERVGKKVYVLGTERVRTYLKEKGVDVVEEVNAHDADIMLLTFDQELTYQKIVVANELIVMGKEYISTHPDFVCPTQGISIPDAGAFIEMFKASSNRLPDVILGKPYAYMANFLVDTLGVKREQVAMVGDRLYTDIRFGLNAGVKTVLVLSGETTRAQYEESGLKVDLVLQDVNELID